MYSLLKASRFNLNLSEKMRIVSITFRRPGGSLRNPIVRSPLDAMLSYERSFRVT